MRGQVYKVHTDSYLVKCGEKLYNCKARGVLKLRRNGIFVGDFVEVENNVIVSVCARKNRFIRPNVANIDLIIAVVSPEPKPDFLLVDKLLLNANKEGVKFVIAVNKQDLDTNLYEYVVKEYGSLGIEILTISAKTKDGLFEFKNLLSGKLTVLAGQSAAGKTSIINSIFNLTQRVGELSEKISRGKHTTTRSEIFELDGVRLVDSPGFAVIDAMVSVEELPDCYDEYFSVSSECKYRGCCHISEPDCKVKELVSASKLSKDRYDRYVEIYKEILERRNNYEKD